MKIRSTIELRDAITHALSWRKRELASLRSLIERRQPEHEKAALRRSAVPVLYAHWEGFTKEVAEFYLNFVSYRRLSLSELRGNFVALACRDHFKAASETHKISVHEKLIDHLRENWDKRARIPRDHVIDTESNLKPDVLKSVFSTIGIEYDAFWMGKEIFISGSLIKTRNEIVHGENTFVDGKTYLELHRQVIQLLDRMRTCIENASVSKAYRLNP